MLNPLKVCIEANGNKELQMMTAPRLPDLNPNRPKIALRRLDAWAKQQSDNAPLKKQIARVRHAIQAHEMNKGTEAEKTSLESVSTELRKLEAML
jgi:hypothetical protein